MHEESTCKTILIVEDEQIIGDLICEILREELHIRAYRALNGAQALALIERLTPDLVILDYQLPDMHGLQLYDHFHARRDLAAVPALMVSANPPLGEIAQRQLPYLQKPFELDELISRARLLLSTLDHPGADPGPAAVCPRGCEQTAARSISPPTTHRKTTARIHACSHRRSLRG